MRGQRSDWPDRRLAAHRGDQALDPVVCGDERVLAEHRALRLVIQLQVYPVDGVVVAPLLRSTDEVAAELGPRRLRRHCLGTEDRRIGRDAGCQAALLEQGEDPADLRMSWYARSSWAIRGSAKLSLCLNE